MLSESSKLQGLRQNRIKFAVLRVLAQSYYPLGVRELAQSAEVNYQSLATRLPYLTQWHYIRRSTGHNLQGRPCWAYAIAAKGKHWLEKHNGHYGQLDTGDAIPYIKLRDGTKLYKGTPEYDAFRARLKAEPPAKILRWYEFNSGAWVELKLEGNRLYFNGLPDKPMQYTCKNLLSINDAPKAWLDIYGDILPMSLIQQAYKAYRLGLRTGKNQGIAIALSK